MRRSRRGEPPVSLPIHRWVDEHEQLDEDDWVRQLLESRERRDHDREEDLPAELRADLREQRRS